MIGDSISLGYLSGVQAALRGKFAVTHSAGNAGNANKIAHSLDCFLAQVSGSKPSVVTVKVAVMAINTCWRSSSLSVAPSERARSIVQ